MTDPVVLQLHNRHRTAALFRVRAHWGSLPDGIELLIGIAGLPAAKQPADPAAAELFPTVLDAGCGRRVALDPSNIHRLKPDAQRRSDLPEILIPAAQPLFAAIRIVTPAKLPPGPWPQFDVVQLEHGRVVGGCTIQIRAPLT